MDKQSYIDYQALAKRFRVGDKVRFANPVTSRPSAWEGTITHVAFGIGMVDVETPFGNVRSPVEDVYLVGPDPLAEDTSYSSYDKDLSDLRHGDEGYSFANPAPNKKRPAGRGVRVASRYQDRMMDLVACLPTGKDPVKIYMNASENLHAHYGEHELRQAAEMRVALYWKAKGRQYIPTQVELKKREFLCPHCDNVKLKLTNYKKHTKLYACPECLFLIKPGDIYDRTRPDDEGPESEFEEGPGVSGVPSDSSMFRHWKGEA